MKRVVSFLSVRDELLRGVRRRTFLGLDCVISFNSRRERPPDVRSIVNSFLQFIHDQICGLSSKVGWVFNICFAIGRLAIKNDPEAGEGRSGLFFVVYLKARMNAMINIILLDLIVNESPC